MSDILFKHKMKVIINGPIYNSQGILEDTICRKHVGHNFYNGLIATFNSYSPDMRLYSVSYPSSKLEKDGWWGMPGTIRNNQEIKRMAHISIFKKDNKIPRMTRFMDEYHWWGHFHYIDPADLILMGNDNQDFSSLLRMPKESKMLVAAEALMRR